MSFPYFTIRRPDPAELRVQRHNGEAMRALYRQVPKIECQGKCWDSCSVVDHTPWEGFMAERAGVPLATEGLLVTADDDVRSVVTACTALDPETHRCRIYAARPMICRIWGVFEALQCPYGCVPEGGFIPGAEAVKLMALSMWYGGSPRADSPERVELIFSDPDLARRMLNAYPKPIANEPVMLSPDQFAQFIGEEE